MTGASGAQRSEGMRSREKYFWQSVIGLLAALYLVFCISEDSNARVLELFSTWIKSGFYVNLPTQGGADAALLQNGELPAGRVGFVILSYLVIVGSSKRRQFTDGLDGLAIMPVAMVGGSLGLFALRHGQRVLFQISVHAAHHRLGRTAGFLHGHGRRELGVLWFNTHPAQVFMGDVGALALGRSSGHRRGDRASRNCARHHGGVFVPRRCR